jgi:hypothetical protein
MTARTRTTAVWLEDATQGLMSFGSIREAAEYYADNTEPGTYPLAACDWWVNSDGRTVIFDCTDRLTDAIDAARREAAEGDDHIAHESAALRGAQI